MNLPNMYAKARNEVEPMFIRVLKKLGLEDVHQGSRKDDFQHIDVFATKNGITWSFDVKDKVTKYQTSMNYSMSLDMTNDIKKNPTKYRHHMIACYLGNGKFACFKTLALVPFLRLKNRKSDGKQFYQFNVEECMHNLKSNEWKLIS